MSPIYPFTFIHAADLHLDAPFEGIYQAGETVASVLRAATFQAFCNLVEACRERKADFLLLAGDVYNSKDRSLKAQLAFREGLRELQADGIQVYIVHGNHDPLDGWSAGLRWPDNTHAFGAQCESFRYLKDGEEVAEIVGVSYPRREVRENLVPHFIQERASGLFRIALLHSNVGNRSQENYAPCLQSDLAGLPYDYWALGHVHTPEVLRSAYPAIVYPGNPQGLQINETGAHGAWQVFVDTSGNPRLEFVPLDIVRWVKEDIDLNTATSEQDLEDAILERLERVRNQSDHHPTICRITLVGRTSFHANLSRQPEIISGFLESLRNQEEGRADFVWLERILDHTRPPLDREQLRKQADFSGGLAHLVDAWKQDPAALAGLRQKLVDACGAKLASRLGEIWAGHPAGGYQAWAEDGDIQLWLDEAEAICLDSFEGGGDAH